MITLNAAVRGDVSSPQSIDIATNEHGVTLYIFTGISMPRMFNHDNQLLFLTSSHVRSEVVQVTVGHLSALLIAAAAQVSLARIWSYPGLFNFHLTDVWVEQATDGNIILKYAADMTGTAGLVGVSYQVNVKAVSIETEIRGIIRWNSRFRARRTASLFEIRVRGGAELLTGMADGDPAASGHFVQLSFVVRHAQLGASLVISVAATDEAFFVDGVPSEAIGVRQTAGPNPVLLTTAQPRRSDLVFELYEIE